VAAKTLGRVASDFIGAALLFREADDSRRLDPSALRNHLLALLDAFMRHPVAQAVPDEAEEARFALQRGGEREQPRQQQPARIARRLEEEEHAAARLDEVGQAAESASDQRHVEPGRGASRSPGAHFFFLAAAVARAAAGVARAIRAPAFARPAFRSHGGLDPARKCGALGQCGRSVHRSQPGARAWHTCRP